MNIYLNSKIKEINQSYYKVGLESTNKSLDLCKNLNNSIDKEYNIFLYWIGDNVNYKHSVVIKSFLATQNLNFAKLKIYSDVDISTNEVFKRYSDFKQVEFHIFDVESEIIGTKYESFKYVKSIKEHLFNPAYESDFFRLLMLNKYGGFYIDFDVLLLRDLSPLLDYEFFYKWGDDTNNLINGAIMKLQKDIYINNLLTDEILNKTATPGNGSLTWASDIYHNVKNKSEDLIIFPAAFFNSEWQSNLVTSTGIESMKSHQYSEILYDGCFTWHWHNKWNEDIEIGSKFNILDNLLENKFQQIKNLSNY